MYSVYKIMYQDTLDSIANKVGITVDELIKLNGNIDFSADSYIVVPNNNVDFFKTYIVKSGDNLYKIAQEFDVNVNDLAMINGIKKDEYLYPNQQLIVPSNKTLVYVTKEGDTIDVVLDNFKTNYDKIIRQNKKIYLLPDQLIVFKEENF